MTITASVNGSFRDIAQRIVAKVDSRVNTLIKELCAGILDDLIAQTPQRSGQAKANWQVALSLPNDVFIELRDAVRHNVYDAQDVADALAYGQATIAVRESGQTVWIFNNAPYIRRLDEGYSPQADAGYVTDILEARLEVFRQNIGAL